MSSAPYSVMALDAVHERASFSSDSEPLNRYFQQQVTQDIRRRVAACFVAVTDEQRVAGYYTLAATSLLLAELPASVGKKPPRYPSVPAVRVGRLAVDQAFQKQGLGGALLADAFTRSVRSEIAAFALVVDAKHELAARFYLHHGFVALPSNPLSLFLPLATVRRAM
ncbi:GNAT family N-acetyltransferase [Caballeronia sp. LjRoot34]|uniref:GNAT family N-acetyltransferase n=1 Tax=Caballeronia sp. LjRoot34 TaxID=3342325 RepID=UPI003ECC81FB